MTNCHTSTQVGISLEAELLTVVKNRYGYRGKRGVGC